MSTILLVDDEEDALWIFQLALESQGYHVILANSGQAALSKASRCLPDLIVTDWNMPGTDGVELCERLKYYPALAQIPIVMSSGDTPPKEKSSLWNVFLPKPVELSALESVIGSLLARRLASPHHDTHVPAPAPSRWPAMPVKLLF
ncbi:response regulator [Paraburkholderia sp. DHOC27]|uniref:response regulator n=1 Tax=Paraburkholderia sp. DHOC27 TaxID=2303330 RepID=UPI000E3CF3A4|nr:response regulator [Paraburkholderia sp. DHOC27]RFU46953.1 response regulator [Paraburkholderia sp. DHOC27]